MFSVEGPPGDFRLKAPKAPAPYQRSSVLDPAFVADISDLLAIAADIEEYVRSIKPGQAVGKERIEEFIILLRKARTDVIGWL